mgnify:FL=1
MVKTTKIVKKYKTKNGEEKEIEINYAKVPDRLRAFHEKNKNNRIETSYNINGNMVIVRAIIVPDLNNIERFFTGHSFGSLSGDKVLEKLETVAVGRALAFSGLFADGGEIASEEELEKFRKEESQKSAEKFEKVEELKKEAGKITDIAELRRFMAKNSGLGKEFDNYIIELSKKLKETK